MSTFREYCNDQNGQYKSASNGNPAVCCPSDSVCELGCGVEKCSDNEGGAEKCCVENIIENSKICCEETNELPCYFQDLANEPCGKKGGSKQKKALTLITVAVLLSFFLIFISKATF